jgi:hypothetical protein
MASDALFHGRRFYLTRAMGPQHRQSVRELIQVRAVYLQASVGDR